MIRENEVYKIGVLTKTHGISGELNMNFTDDVFDTADVDYLICRVDGILVPFFIEEYRFRNDTTILIKLEDVDNEVQARYMIGTEVFCPKELATLSNKDTYTWSYFEGFHANEQTAGRLGVINGVDDSTMNVLFYILTPQGKELLIPACEEFITSIDHEARTLTLKLPQGLLNLDETDE